ncbi:MAG TPA: heat-inducible transcriptional repressor HrcA [Parachlamydiaceae bacterium]|nr:heat-inducible transcriptional repressor HrcA [Parachlamydiaceae bacterium]
MKVLKPHIKKSGKTDRERKVLIGLVEHYIQTGKPVGSNVLKDVGFEDLSSATIRNYFAHLEEEGYLAQQHSSGGRIPTDNAFRLYANEYTDEAFKAKQKINLSEKNETRAITTFLQQSAEELATLTGTAVFLSAPRFEQDFIIGIKLVIIDTNRCLCVLMTDFGEIRTEMLYTEQKLGVIATKRLEAYFNWRLMGQHKPENLNKQEEDLAQKLYNELMVRYIVGYSQFNEEEVYRTGFSSLLSYPEFQDPTMLANSLALFENTHGMRLLLKECSKFDKLKFWIGRDLTNYSTQTNVDCSVVAIPYYVNNKPVGSIGLFGPLRMPYRSLFNILRQYSEQISKVLTNSLYKFKITLRQSKAESIGHKLKPQLLAHIERPLLEDNREENHHSNKRNAQKKSREEKVTHVPS